MKINDTQRIAAANTYRKANEDRIVQIEGKKQHKKKDEVNISPEAKQLLGASETKQVEDLKQSYLSGTYHVEASKIAEKLLPYI